MLMYDADYNEIESYPMDSVLPTLNKYENNVNPPANDLFPLGFAPDYGYNWSSSVEKHYYNKFIKNFMDGRLNDKIIKDIKDKKKYIKVIDSEDECSVCLDDIEYGINLDCGHKFCKSCISSFIDSEKHTDDCSYCRKKVKWNKITLFKSKKIHDIEVERYKTYKMIMHTIKKLEENKPVFKDKLETLMLLTQ